MPYISEFQVEGLAGRDGSYSASLNRDVNVFFGANGSGKTSLLRILHSALAGDASMLEDVPFSRATVQIQPYQDANPEVLRVDREIFLRENARPQDLSGLIRPSRRRVSLQWHKEPEDAGNWSHRYLPISRLYASVQSPDYSSYGSLYQESPLTEKALEGRFKEAINQLWKNYISETTQLINHAQEEGLARILESVIARSESYPEDSSTDAATAYAAVANFLRRRGMEEVVPTEAQFHERYSSERQLRSVARDIESIENRISVVTAPRANFKALVDSLLYAGKTLTLSTDDLGVSAGDTRLDLGGLSSGEKQLLWILLETMLARVSVIVIDEPELSMHVDWQRRLIASMRTVNPSVQMVVATHSPEIMAELEDDKIFRL